MTHLIIRTSLILKKGVIEGVTSLIGIRRYGQARVVAVASLLCGLGVFPLPAQQLDASSVIQQVDAAVKARFDNLAGYTVTEHYAVYRGKDETHSVAEMTVKTTYARETGKSYNILSQSGSQLIRNLVLSAILDNEKHINEPGVREGSWITSANYDMKLKPGGTQVLDGRECLLLALTPKRKAPYLLQGTLCVDASDGSIVQVEGVSSASSSVLTGPTKMMRQYENLEGFAEATHARAVSDSFLFGQTIVKIDYQDYQFQLRPAL
jgi:outer membrane lipoprotein-sorting protein